MAAGVYRIAIVDDDQEQGALVAEFLSSRGFLAVVFQSPERFLRSLHHDTFDLILLDWLMPAQSGFEVLQEVRSKYPLMPVIMMTCRCSDADVIAALDEGADDYAIKPVNTAILNARITAVLRRKGAQVDVQRGPMELGPYRLDPKSCTVTFAGKSVVLTNREFALAWLFFTNPNRPLSRQYVLDQLWGKGTDSQTRTLDTHIARLRTKLWLGKANGVRLNTLYGFGYRLEKVEEMACL